MKRTLFIEIKISYFSNQHSFDFIPFLVSDMNNDPWLTKHQIVDPLRLHALGAVSAYWNCVEQQAISLFMFVSKVSYQQARILVHDMSMNNIFFRITNMAESRTASAPSQSTEVINCIKHLAKQVDICRQNRNLLTHSLPVKVENETFLIRVKGPAVAFYEFNSSLEDLRRVVEDIVKILEYSQSLTDHISAILENSHAPALPKELPLPKLLWIPPNPQKKPNHKKHAL